MVKKGEFVSRRGHFFANQFVAFVSVILSQTIESVWALACEGDCETFRTNILPLNRHRICLRGLALSKQSGRAANT